MRTASTVGGSDGTASPGTTVTPSPAATRPSFAVQSLATNAISGCHDEPVQAPSREEPGSALPAIQRSARSAAGVALGRVVSGCPAGTATKSGSSSSGTSSTPSGVLPGGVTTARSSRRRATAVSSDGLSPSRNGTCNPGARRETVAIARGTSAASAVENAPTRNRPPGWASSSRRSWRAASSSPSTASARRSSNRPASVGCTPRDRRSNSGCPAACSISAICRETADCV
ncbi:hypothetical protein GCM10027199_75820 [Amycolatopsis magusensis]